jgi:hypothetical protein
MNNPLSDNPLRRLARTALLAGLLASAGSVVAAEDITLNTFATSDEAALWRKWWGAAGQTYEFDASKDADGNPNSGALKATIDFNLATYGGDNQFAVLREFPVVEGSKYTNLVFDLFWDPASPQRPWGDFGGLEPGFRNQDFSQNWLPGYAVPTTPGWQRVVLPINPTAPKIDTINGVVLKMWSGDASWGQTGTATFWIDNVRLIAAPEAPAGPTTLSIEPAKRGLRAFASAPGAQYQRQNFRTVNSTYSWVGAGQPVTYSFTIADYPDGNYSGFQTHLFLVPGTGLPNWLTAPDWNEANVIFLQMGNNADGSAYASFRYKTNQPSGNSMYFGNGTLATVGSTSPRGTWSLRFNSDTAVSLTSPSGETADFTLPAESAALFNGPLSVYFGVQPNAIANIGQSATFSRLQISGVSTPIDETFATPPDGALWQVVADDVTGVVPVPGDVLFWINWTLPDRDWVLQWAEDLDNDFWNDIGTPSPMNIGGLRRSLIRSTDLPQSFFGNYYFRMIRR